jgi:hypothetical protein
MRKYLMTGAATAALIFGLSQAIAQSSMGASEKEKAPAATSGSMSGGASGAMDHSKSDASKTIGQARDEKSDLKNAQTPSSPKMGAGDQKMGAGPGDQMKQNAQRDSDSLKSKSKMTTGQSKDQMKDENRTTQDMNKAGASTSKMGAQPNAAQGSSSSSTKMGQQPSTNQNSAQGSSSSNVTTGAASSSATQLTTEQRTEIREKVLASAPRETNVTFALNIGTVVPRTVHVVEVPETLVRIHPEWRRHRFFVANDEIIIVDNQFRIIAVLQV